MIGRFDCLFFKMLGGEKCKLLMENEDELIIKGGGFLLADDIDDDLKEFGMPRELLKGPLQEAKPKKTSEKDEAVTNIVIGTAMNETPTGELKRLDTVGIAS